jgi:hypothetical protein
MRHHAFTSCRPWLLGAVLCLLPAMQQPLQAQQAAPPHEVLDDLVPEHAPERSFMPKYPYEFFFGLGYSGTQMSWPRQYPTLVGLAPEVLFWRPGHWDFGAFAEIRYGRPDEALHPLELGAGLTVMWRFNESTLLDWALVLRQSYLLDVVSPDVPLFRTGLGLQVSVVRWVALMPTFDLLATSKHFGDGDHFKLGFGVMLKLGLCPMVDCPPPPTPQPRVLDRSPVTCEAAGEVCRLARTGPKLDSELCDVVAQAIDASSVPAQWGDSVTPFLAAIGAKASPQLRERIGSALNELEREHAASMRALRGYPDKLKDLKSDERYDRTYSYLVTPANIRDWLGCSAEGIRPACPTTASCYAETGAEKE